MTASCTQEGKGIQRDRVERETSKRGGEGGIKTMQYIKKEHHNRKYPVVQRISKSSCNRRGSDQRIIQTSENEYLRRVRRGKQPFMWRAGRRKKNVNENSEFMHTQEQERGKKPLCVKTAPSFDNKTKKKKKSLNLTSDHQDLWDV